MNEYLCFSPRLMLFLTERGFQFKRMAVHHVTGKTFFSYDKTQAFEAALSQFTKEKKEALDQ